MNTSYHVLQDAMGTLHVIKGTEGESPLFRFVQTCAQSYEKLQKPLCKLHLNLNDYQKTLNTCSSIFNELLQAVTKAIDSNSLFTYFQALLAVEKAIKIKGNLPHELNELYDDLADEFQDLGQFLENFHKSKDVTVAINIGVTSSTINTICEKLDFLIANLSILSGYNRGGADALSLYFPEGSDASDFLAKLQAINNIYLNICFLMDVEITSEPLEIIKIESGSKFLKVAGNKVAVGIIATIIGTFSDFTFESFTQKGRVEALSKKAEVIEQAIDITKELEAAGVDTTKHKERLSVVSIKLIKDLSILMSGEPEVEINGKSHSIAMKHKEKYLETTRRMLLEHKKQEESAAIEELKAEIGADADQEKSVQVKE